MMLKGRGSEPKHHGYMAENRGMPTDHEEFYMHFHPLEDLVAFLDNPHANDDPVDQTIGSEFEVKIYTRRWGHDDTYTFIRTNSGWNINNLSIGGECNKGGHPSLFQNFRQDNVQHPANFDGWLEYLWEKAASEGLSEEQLQAGLDALANWVSMVEKNTPNVEPLGGYA